MGWTSSYQWQTKKQLVDHIIEPSFWGENYTVLKHSLRGNNLWILAEQRHPEKGTRKFIALFLLSYFAQDNGYAYKDMDETCGPCELNCPKNFVLEAEKSGEGWNDYAIAWRKKVLEYHANLTAKKKARPSLEAGLVLDYFGTEYRLVSPAGARRGWLVDQVSNGCRFRMSAQQLAAAKPVNLTVTI